MLTKCPFDSYAWYDEWGNRYLVFSHNDLRHIWRMVRRAYVISILGVR